MKENISPEEKLLRLIRRPKKFVSKPKPRLRFSFRIHSPISFSKKIIFLAFFVSCLYLVFVFAGPMIGFYDFNLIEENENQVVDQGDSFQVETKSYQDYLNGIQGKEIFSSPVQPEKKTIEKKADPNLLKNLSLVGILGGNNPQAIIENTRAKKTYYLKEGQSLGELKVEKIEEGKVTLIHKGVNFELYL